MSRKLAWRSNSEIFVMNGRGARQVNLTKSRAADYAPAWSQDGRNIAFTRGLTGEGNAEVVVMKVDGKHQTNITKRAGNDFDPTWSPDGRKIAFATDRSGSYIYAMNADGSAQKRLASGTNPAWSPDGTKIAFTRSRDDTQVIFTMNSDGSRQTQLTHVAATAAAWSPDGRKIAFEGGPAAEEIWVMKSDGSGRTKLADGIAPAWSPDGKKIAFVMGSANNEIFVMNADGSGRTRLTRNSVEDNNPSWSPDGRQIAFSRDIFCSVPRVVGRRLPAARRAIVKAYCAVGRIRYARSARPAGLVMRQSPRSGTALPAGSRVNLVVSRSRR